MCRLHGRDQGRQTEVAIDVRHLRRRGTIATASLPQSGVEGRGCEAHSYLTARASRFASTSCKRCDAHHRYPSGCPSWRRKGKTKLLVLPSGADAWRCTWQALRSSSDVRVRGDPCQTWLRESSRLPPLNRHPEAGGCELRPASVPLR